MQIQLIQPQEVEVFYIIPAIRKEMALSLKNEGKKQKDIAKILGVRESTVSQYLTEKRAAMVQFPIQIKKAIKQAAGRVSDKLSLINEVQKLLLIIKQSNILCTMHKKLGTVPKTCEACILK